MSMQSEYRRFCGEASTLPLMMTSTWMDIVCGEDGWDAVMVSDSEGVKAALPFQIKRKLQISKLRTPPFTADSGPWLRSLRKNTTHGQLSEYHSTMEELMMTLPKADFMEFKLDNGIDDIQPFLWQGYDAHPMYSYILDIGNDQESLMAGFNRTVRKELNRGDLGYLLDVGVEDVLPFMDKHHKYWNDEIKGVIHRLLDHDELVVQAVAHSDGDREVSMQIYVEDGETLYFLSSAVDREGEDKKSYYKLLILLMEEMHGSIKRINFMGSMDKNISHNFRAMGAIPKLHFRVTKARRTWMSWAK